MSSKSHGQDDQGATARTPIWTLRLWGLENRRIDLAASAITVIVLLVTRFAFLASGPWEWDETLFARGILSFDIRAHFPHPPGFPLWLALGWLVKPFVSEPLVGLQLLSAAMSVLTLWPLSALARRAAPPLVATATTLVFLMLPGVWLYAPRGFSETPSAFFAIWAAALVVDGLEGRRATAFSALLTASFLIRPILLPSLGLLWIAGALTVRPRRRLLPGVAAGAGAAIVATAAMVVIQGSWASFTAAFADHATRHARGLAENVAGFPKLGIVAGTGGVWVAVTFLVLAALGLIVWARRRGARFAAAWAAVWIVGVAQLVWLQDRTYPRYAVPFQLAAAPLVAAAAATVAPAAAAAWGMAALGVFLSAAAYPAVVEQHATEMPAWAALRFAAHVAERHGYDLVVEPGLAPFTSYLQEVDKSHGRPWKARAHLAPTPSIVKTLPSGPYLVVTDKPQRYLPAIEGRAWLFSAESEELDALGQGRFERAMVLENPPLPISGWQTVRRDERKIPFVWGGTQARLLLPPLPASVSVALDVEPTRGPASLELQVNGVSSMVISGSIGRRTIWLDPGLLVPGRTNELAFSREEGYSTGQAGKTQGLRLSGLRGAGGPYGWSGSVITPTERYRLGVAIEADAGAVSPAIDITGTYPAERFPAGVATWTTASSHLHAPASAGILRLIAWAPRPTPARLEVWLDGKPFAGPLALAAKPSPLALCIGDEAAGARMNIELKSTPWVPEPSTASAHGPLGVVLGGIDFAAIPGQAGQTWSGDVDERGRGWSFRMDSEGMYSEETFAGARGAWTKPSVTLRLPGGPGRVTLTAWAPRPVPPHLEIWSGGRRLAGPMELPNAPATVTIDLPRSTPADRLVELELRCAPFVPGGRDTRQLGVVISEIAYTPAAAPR